MNLLIYDKSGKKVDELQNYTSIQWISKYAETGQFEIHCSPTQSNLENLIDGARLVNQETREIGFVSYIVNDDSGDSEDFEIRGYFNNLDQRINPTTFHIGNETESDVYRLVLNNLRGLEVNLEPTEIDLRSDLEMDTTWKTLRETIEEVCAQTGFGYRMVADKDSLNRLGLYDRGLRNVKFSDKLSNLNFQVREFNSTDYKNYAYVCAQGQGDERTVVEVDLTNGGERFELYVDSRNTSKKYTGEDGKEHEYTESEYLELLRNEGLEKLAEHKCVKEFSFKINPNDTLFRLGIDYDLGDIVYIESVKYNIDSVPYRITGITRIDENGTESIELEVSLYEQEIQVRKGVIK